MSCRLEIFWGSVKGCLSAAEASKILIGFIGTLKNTLHDSSAENKLSSWICLGNALIILEQCRHVLSLCCLCYSRLKPFSLSSSKTREPLSQAPLADLRPTPSPRREAEMSFEAMAVAVPCACWGNPADWCSTSKAWHVHQGVSGNPPLITDRTRKLMETLMEISLLTWNKFDILSSHFELFTSFYHDRTDSLWLSSGRGKTLAAVQWQSIQTPIVSFASQKATPKVVTSGDPGVRVLEHWSTGTLKVWSAELQNGKLWKSPL